MGLSSLWPLSSIEMYFSLVPSMDAALTWLTIVVSRCVGGEPAGQDLAAPPVEDAQPVRVGVGVDPAEDRPAGVGCRFVSHVSLRSFRARLDRADGTLTGRDRMRLIGSAVSLHAPIRSCGGLGSPRPARDMSGNEGSPVGASGMWGHRAVRI